MDPKTLFLVGCIPARLFIVFLTFIFRNNYSLMNWFAYFALIPVFGFLFFYFTGTRTVGIETGGKKIWWNNWRPIHAFLFFMFSFTIIFYKKYSFAWMWLFLDWLIGMLAHYIHYY